MTRRLGWTWAMAAAIVVGSGAPAALAAGECTLVGAQLTVDMTAGSLVGEEVHVRRNVDDIELWGGSGFFLAACPGATVSTVNEINVLGNADRQTFVIDQVGGAFEPGATAETVPNVSEIEFDLALGAGNDVLSIVGQPGNDHITVGANGANLNDDGDLDSDLGGVDVLLVSGGDGNDFVTYEGGAGTGAASSRGAQARGNDGNDELRGAGLDDVMFGGAGDDLLLGSGGGDELLGEADDDELFFGPGDDDIFGSDAPDGADRIDGGIGHDVLHFELRTLGVNVTQDGVADDGEIATAENDNVSGVEAVLGGSGDDQLEGTAGRDFLFGAGGHDSLIGGAGDDSLRPGEGDDDVFGGDGRDDLYADTAAPDGADVLSGGPGADALSYALRTADVRATNDGLANDGDIGTAEGDDIASIEELTGGKGNDEIEGTPGNDELGGGPGDDTIRGLDGHDDLVGGMGDDMEVAGPGFDTFSPLNTVDGADTMVGGAGKDVVGYYGRNGGVEVSLDGVANDGSIGANENDNVVSVGNIRGGHGNDLLVGSNGREDIDGLDGNDRIYGNGDGDDITGGPGADRIEAGDGIDVVVPGPGGDTVRLGAGRDDVLAADGTRDFLYGGPGDDRGRVDVGLDFLNSVETLF